MRNLFLFITLLTFLIVSCKDGSNSTKPQQEQVPLSKTVAKKDIIIDFEPTYLSPNAQPIVVKWKEYLDVQKKVYELKETNTLKLKGQLIELESLIIKLLNSKFPEKLNVPSFEKQLVILEESITDLKNAMSNNNSPIQEIIGGTYRILREYKRSKMQINILYK